MKKYPSPKPEHLKFAVLATDVVLFSLRDGELVVRLIAVDRPPAFPAGSKGFPGGLIRPTETAEEAAVRIIKDKAGVSEKKLYIEQLRTFSAVNRDPRGRVVSVSYLAMVPWEKLSEKERKDTPESWWAKVGDAKPLSYDHDEMLFEALKRLRSRVSYTTLIQKLMPKEFTLGMLEKAYEEILGVPQDKRNFRKKIAKIKVLKELSEKQTGEPYRPAQLYKFASETIKDIEII
ncbi:MAG: NUDIX domain-containing protein [Patescibacteria group bacterium]|jgi:8-oxo-dGTP diphosphatase